MEHEVQHPPSPLGTGGKFPRRPPRQPPTPYDRPTRLTRRRGVIQRLVVDPTSKLFNFAARRFFAMVFANKRLHNRPSVEAQERRNGLQETAIDAKIDSGVREPVGDVCCTSSINNDTNGLSELEQLLKQKNFTRSEIDHLNELLKSRADASPVKDDRHGFKLNTPGQKSVRHQEFPSSSNINKNENSGAHRASLPAPITKEQNMHHDSELRIASPTELAKAYMSSRPTKVSPSALGLRAQIGREDSVPPRSSPYTSKSQFFALPEITSGYSGVLENGFSTPKSHGRSAIYNMACTPYPRFNPVTHQKGSGSKNYGDSSSILLTSRSPSENGRQVASKPMALKRRSNVLDDEIGSIGPIRRIRQKHNLLSHGKPVTPNRNCMSNVDAERASSSNANYAHVPRKSSEMAAKILERLETMTPKEKSLESKLAAAREGSTFKLAPHMLHGQALRSMEDADASKLFQSSQKDQKLVDHPVSRLPDFHEYTTQKQGSAEEQAPVKSVLLGDNFTSDSVVQAFDNSTLGYSVTPSFSSQPSEKKRPFKMSAHENWIEMDDDHSNEHGPESSGKGVEEPMRDNKSALTEDKTLDNFPVSLKSTHTTPVLAGESNPGDKFLTSFAPNTSSLNVLSQSAEVGDSHLLFSSGSATTNNNLASVETKFQTSSSLMNVFSGATNAVGVDNANNTRNSGLDNTVNGNLGKSPSVFNPTVTNNMVSVEGSSTNDGPLSSNQSFINSSSSMASLAGATTSTSALSDKVIAPANGNSSNLSKRLSLSDNTFSKKLFSAPSTTGSTEATDVQAANRNGLRNFSNSSSVNTSSGTSTGFSIFNFGTSASSSAINSQWPSSASGTSVSKESSLTGSRSDNVSVTTPAHFDSSFSCTGFGFSGVAPLTASISFGYPIPATKSEGTTQNSASVSESDLVNSVDGAAPSYKFRGGASASEGDQGAAFASPQSNAFGSADAASLATSQFSASFATPASSSTSLLNSNAGSSAPGVYSFNAGFTSSGTSAGNTSSGVFKFCAAPSVPTSSANTMTSSSSTALANFGFPASAPQPSSDSTKVSCSTFDSSLQTPASSFVPPFTMPSPTGFPVGSSLSAFGTSSTSMVFGPNYGVPSTPASSFVPPFTMPSPTGFSVGSSSSAFGTSSTSMVFGPNYGVPSNPTFSSTQSAGTHNVFGNSTSLFTTTSQDCMAEDPMQSSAPAPVFGQSRVSPSPPGYMFGSTAPSPVAPFQFSESQAGQQNPMQFQAPGGLEFNAGGSFSLGSSDKSKRKRVKIDRERNRNRKMR